MVAGLYLASVMPYVFAHGYVPTSQGVMARTAYGLVLFLQAAMAVSLCQYNWRMCWMITAVVVFCSTTVNWGKTIHYADVYRRELLILEEVEQRANRGEKVFSILPVVHIDKNPVIGFAATWDFDSAVRIYNGRPDLKGHVVWPK